MSGPTDNSGTPTGLEAAQALRFSLCLHGKPRGTTPLAIPLQRIDPGF
jgi:hypothetical protein